MLKLKRVKYKNKFVNIYEDRGLVFGFTELGFALPDMAAFFELSHIIELKQVHSDMVLCGSRIEPGDEGDGIILEQENRIAVIKTADCVPLFFWDKDFAFGGIIHVGWQGLHKGIEKRLLELLVEKSPPVDPGNLYFYLGPSIERACYEVGQDLYEMFSKKSYREGIFFEPAVPPGIPISAGKKYLLDIKKGIALSLQEEGIRAEQVMSSGICTFCERERFPSYRRDNKTGSRIYNFLFFRSGLEKKS
ncbi:MAG: polyphenol oxidase family protein [Candidatus Aminicenantes bacterium]|nr:polyphenol oxidase family protein [Candidatus Aminicenantes bacterium]